MNCTFGIDIGGTEVKIGKFYDDRLVYKTSIKTNISNHGKNILNDIFDKIDELLADDHLLGIGIGVPGPVVNNFILGAQNLGWGEYDAKAEVLARYPDIKVAILNDANSAALGEMANGGAKKYHSFVFMTLGTGIGGGIVIDGKLIEGVSGSTGEIGHIRVGYDNQRQCTCGLYDCIEQYASATGIVKTAHELRKNHQTILNEVEVTAKTIFDLAKSGDEVAKRVVSLMVERLASAIAAIANTVNPEAIVIGGGVSKAGTFLLDKLQTRFKELAFYSVRNTEFALATLGNDAGIYGTNYRIRMILNDC